MAVFQLKGDIISYVYDSTTTSPGDTDYTRKIGFSDSFSNMSVGSTYTMYISTDDFKSNDITDIIDLLDGVQSTKGYPVIGSKTAPQPPSTRCNISNPTKSLIFDVLYGTETPNLTYNYVSLTIKIVEKIGTSNFTNEETLYFTYNFYGEGGERALNSGGAYQVVDSSPDSNGEVRLQTTGSNYTGNLSDVAKFEIYTSDLYNTDYTELLELIYNSLPNTLLTIKKDGSEKSNVYTITSSSVGTNLVSFTSSAVATTNETYTTDDTLFFTFDLAGQSGSSGSSGTSGNDGAPGTSGSSGSSGTSGSSGSSGTSGSSGSSGTSGSSGSSGSGSSGSSGTSGNDGAPGTSGSSGSSGTSGSSGSSGTSGSSGSSGTSGSSGSSGTSGSSGSSGTSGIVGGVEFEYSTTLSTVQNNSGKLSYNTSTNNLRISNRDNHGNTVSDWVDRWDEGAKGVVTLQSENGEDLIIGHVNTVTSVVGTPGARDVSFESTSIEDWSGIANGELVSVNFSKKWFFRNIR
jgi:hypothetical protein